MSNIAGVISQTRVPSRFLECDNPLIWILEDDHESMFVYREIFEVRYRTRELICLKELEEILKIQAVENEHPNLLIADLRLSDGNFLKFLRSSSYTLLRSVPTIIVSSCDDLDIMREVFQEGTLDYLVKPFTKNQLIAKIGHFFRNYSPIRFNEGEKLRLEPETLSLYRGTRGHVSLTPKEVQILSVFQKLKGKAVDRNYLREFVWREVRVGDKTLEVHMANLRKKLESLGCHVYFVQPDSYMLSGDWMDSPIP